MLSLPVVFVFGSRSLPPSGGALASSLGSSLAAGGFGLSVGCAPGADLAFLSGFSSVPGASARVRAFAVGSSSGRGFPSPSVSLPPLLACAAAGGSVAWCVGGPPSFPLRVRLARRSAAAGAAGSAGFAVAVVSSWSSPGSRGSVRRCLAAGVSVFVFPVGAAAVSRLSGARAGGWPRLGWSSSASLFGLSCFLVSPR